MILTAHQPTYLPWLGLFHKAALADTFIVLDQVQYQRNDWNNRNLIKTHQGPAWLTVPVHSKGHLTTTISDIEIDNQKPWAKKHWQTLSQAYSKAPYFRRYAGFFENVYNTRWESLVALNAYMFVWFLEILDLNPIVESAKRYPFSGAKGDLILNICSHFNARVFVFGSQGRNYVDINTFAEKGIHPFFQNYIHPVYPQLHGMFYPNMSIVDLIFNCGDESRDFLLAGNVGRNDLINGKGRP